MLLLPGIAVVSWGPDRLDIFAVFTDTGLYHKVARTWLSRRPRPSNRQSAGTGGVIHATVVGDYGLKPGSDHLCAGQVDGVQCSEFGRRQRPRVVEEPIGERHDVQRCQDGTGIVDGLGCSGAIGGPEQLGPRQSHGHPRHL